MEQPWDSVKSVLLLEKLLAALHTPRAGGGGGGRESHSLDALAVWILWPGLPFLLDSCCPEPHKSWYLSVALGPEWEKP